MKVAELIKELEKYPSEMEVCIFDMSKNFVQGNQDPSPIGIQDITEENIEIVPSDSEKADMEDGGEEVTQFLALHYDNEDYSMETGQISEAFALDIFDQLKQWHDKKIEQLDLILNVPENGRITIKGKEGEGVDLPKENHNIFKAAIAIAKDLFTPFPITIKKIDKEEKLCLKKS